MDKRTSTMLTVTEPDERTDRLQRELRESVLAEIRRRHLSPGELGELLGLLPSGVQVLLDRTSWPIDLAVRVAEAIDLTVELKTAPKQTK